MKASYFDTSHCSFFLSKSQFAPLLRFQKLDCFRGPIPGTVFGDRFRDRFQGPFSGTDFGTDREYYICPYRNDRSTGALELGPGMCKRVAQERAIAICGGGGS